MTTTKILQELFDIYSQKILNAVDKNRIDKCSTSDCPKKDLIDSLKKDKENISELNSLKEKKYIKAIVILSITVFVCLIGIIMVSNFGQNGLSQWLEKFIFKNGR